MNSVEVIARLRKIMEGLGWSEYKLAKESGLSESTLHNIFSRGTLPSIPTLEAICKGLNITLAQFFAEGDMVELSPELKELFEKWAGLTAGQKATLLNLLKEFSKSV